MSSDSEVPVIAFSTSAPGLGTRVSIRVLAEHAGALEEGLLLLGELTERWGPDGELAALAAAPTLRPVAVSPETLLLLSLSEAPGVGVGMEDQLAWRTGPVQLPGLPAQQALAADLLVEELLDAGCLSALVGVGGAWRASGPAIGHAGWAVPLQDADGGRHTVRLRDGGLVTVARASGAVSATAPRAWQAWRAHAS